MIASAHGKKIQFTKVFNPVLYLLGRRFAVINKAFGNLCYDMDMSGYKQEYRMYNLAESIKKSENA